MLKSLLFATVENVDNVDKYLDNLLWETSVTAGIVEKTWELSKLYVELCQVTYAQKNPHAIHRKNVYKHVDNVDNLFSKKMFSDIYNISCAHCNKQVASGAVFQKEVFNFVKGWEILAWCSQFLNAYRYAAGIHTRLSGVDNFRQRGELPRFL